MTCPCNVTFGPTEVVGIHNLNLLAILAAASSYGIYSRVCACMSRQIFLLFSSQQNNVIPIHFFFKKKNSSRFDASDFVTIFSIIAFDNSLLNAVEIMSDWSYLWWYR